MLKKILPVGHFPYQLRAFYEPWISGPNSLGANLSTIAIQKYPFYPETKKHVTHANHNTQLTLGENAGFCLTYGTI